ncbi:MAG: DUF4326 domain-containing protein [Janthinobacterium lividum]
MSPTLPLPAPVSVETPPIRIQRRRTAGFRLQAQSPDGRPVVSVCRPGKWGNEFRVEAEDGRYFVVDANRVPWGSDDGYANRAEAAAYAVKLYGGGWLEGKVHSGQLDLTELRGKHLACFCKIVDECGNCVPCHADVLLSLSNGLTLDEIKHENLKNYARQQGATP